MKPSPKNNQKTNFLSVEQFIVKMDIWNIQISLNILQGEFQEKLNKLESENDGGSSYFGQFLNFRYTTELAP